METIDIHSIAIILLSISIILTNVGLLARRTNDKNNKANNSYRRSPRG